mgnify:CR=1 FL=1
MMAYDTDTQHNIHAVHIAVPASLSQVLWSSEVAASFIWRYGGIRLLFFQISLVIPL